MFTNNYLRIYTNTDVVGVETGAALRTSSRSGAGILHGLGYGDDAKAAFDDTWVSRSCTFRVWLMALVR